MDYEVQTSIHGINQIKSIMIGILVMYKGALVYPHLRHRPYDYPCLHYSVTRIQTQELALIFEVGFK